MLAIFEVFYDASYFFYSQKLTKIPSEKAKDRIINFGPKYKEKYQTEDRPTLLMIRIHKIYIDRVIFHNDVFSNISYCFKGKCIHSENEHDTENETDASVRPRMLHVRPLKIQLWNSTLLCVSLSHEMFS
jgi:hypothetical protein